MGRALQDGSDTQSLVHSAAEAFLSNRDSILACVIVSQQDRWPSRPTEDPIWGLMRIVMAQQISTHLACRLAERVRLAHPSIATPSEKNIPSVESLRAFGLPERRAQCCVNIVQRCNSLRDRIRGGETWESAVTGIKGIGPWTLAVFRIMVLRDPDVLPLGDVGLERAIASVYGPNQDTKKLAENWRPYRSVACWYLWKTLGNEQLG